MRFRKLTGNRKRIKGDNNVRVVYSLEIKIGFDEEFRVFLGPFKHSC